MKLFTDEQMETLRKQISVYVTISDQLLQMHKSFYAKQGMRYENPYFDPSVSLKPQPKQRWTPTAAQLEILEKIYGLGQGTPCKQRIKEITGELQQHGKICETNVYNWFQNRRARTQRKKLRQQNPNNSESEIKSREFDPKKDNTKTYQFANDVGSPELAGIENFLDKLDYPETLSPSPQLDQLGFIG